MGDVQNHNLVVAVLAQKEKNSLVEHYSILHFVSVKRKECIMFWKQNYLNITDQVLIAQVCFGFV